MHNNIMKKLLPILKRYFDLFPRFFEISTILILNRGQKYFATTRNVAPDCILI